MKRFSFSVDHSIITFKLTVNIVLLGVSCKLIDEHQRKLEDKVSKALGGHSASLPASRHNSVTDLTILDEETALHEIKEKLIEQSPIKQCSSVKANVSSGTRSTPHSPNASVRNSLEDITEQVAIVQNSLESSNIFSDSTVSLISINDGKNVKLPEDPVQDENALGSKQTLHRPNRKTLFPLNLQSLRRRVSLQDFPTNISNNYIEQNEPVNKSKIS